jgi:hypothetical protein
LENGNGMRAESGPRPWSSSPTPGSAWMLEKADRAFAGRPTPQPQLAGVAHARPAHGSAPRCGHHAHRDCGGVAPTGGMDDEVWSGDWLKLVEIKEAAPGVEGKARAHRCASASVRWQRKGNLMTFVAGVNPAVVTGGRGLLLRVEGYERLEDRPFDLSKNTLGGVSPQGGGGAVRWRLGKNQWVRCVSDHQS